jgi:nucleoside-diphosphate-sugar epimerase
MSQQVLVTGATGFTGYALCEHLVRVGREVVAFARPQSKTDSLNKLGVEVRRIDIADADQVEKAFQSFSEVYHIAAAFRTEHDELEEFRRANVTATRNLMDAALKSRSGRFVHCSTVGVQGVIDAPPADENYRYRPGDFYQQSKMEGELLVREYIRGGLNAAIVRPVGIYGPGDTRFLKLFRPISRGRFVMIGSGRALYHLTYIDDLIKGFLLAGEREAARGEIFTIGGPRYTTLNELVERIVAATKGPPVRFRIPYFPVYAASVICARACKFIGVEPPLYPRRVEFFSKARAFSIQKARNVLGYEPEVDLDEGLERTATWYRAQGWIK